MNLNYFIAKRIGRNSSNDNRAGGKSNSIASISVGISIAVILVSIAVLNGFRYQIKEKASGFSGDFTFVAPGVDITSGQYPIKINATNNNNLIYKALQIKEVESVYPVSYRAGLLKTQDQIQGVMFKGVDSLYNMEFFKRHLYEGEIPTYTPKELSNDILISKRMADLLGYKLGDKVNSYFIDEDVKVRRFNIKGIYNAQLEELDKVLAIADIKHINRLNGWRNGEVSGYEIILSKDLNNKTLNRIEGELNDIIYTDSSEDDDSVTLNNLRDTYYVLFDWLRLLDINVIVILVLMTAVAGVNMVSGILIILFEKISMIGLLKSMGMTNKNISKVFLYKAGGIILKGMIWGNIVALIAYFIQYKFEIIKLDPSNYFVTFVPVKLTFLNVFLTDILSFIIIMIIVLIPTKFISGISPSVTLRIK